MSHRAKTQKRLKRGVKLALLGLTCVVILIAVPRPASSAADFVVYSIYKPVDLGFAGETPEKDFYVNMGSANGVAPGAQLEVLRIIATYDVNNQKLYKDMIFPIATLKVIHAEQNAAIARMEKLYPADKTPAIMPRAVMIGDRVRLRHP